MGVISLPGIETLLPPVAGVGHNGGEQRGGRGGGKEEGQRGVESRGQGGVQGGEQGRGIVLITQYFRAAHDPEQQRDVDSALVKNLANPHIAEIYLLTETRFDWALLGFVHDRMDGTEPPVAVSSNGTVIEHWGRLRQSVVGGRLTFALALAFANTHLSNRIVLLANADIFFDESLARLQGARLAPEVFTLLKWMDGARYGRDEIVLNIRTDSQDAWVFQPPMNASMLPLAGFVLGAAKCDNRMAEVFATNGHPVSNPAIALRAVEIHSQGRDPSGLYGTKGAPFGETRTVLLSDRHTFS